MAKLIGAMLLAVCGIGTGNEVYFCASIILLCTFVDEEIW